MFSSPWALRPSSIPSEVALRNSSHYEVPPILRDGGRRWCQHPAALAPSSGTVVLGACMPRRTHRVARRSDGAVLSSLQANARWRTFASCHAKLGLCLRNPSFLPLHDSRGFCRQRNARISAVAEEGGLGGGNANLPRCIVLDIEGTTTPISFVTDVLFPYARDNVRQYLFATYDSEETQNDIRLLRAQVQDDLEQEISGCIPIPQDSADKNDVIDSLVHNVHAMIKADRKVSALKELQGHIWRVGFQGKELQGVMFDDVPEAFRKWHNAGIKIYIYSSGSREAQRLIFGNTAHGDLRKYLCGFFDTMIGKKTEACSYHQISQFVGVDHPSEILFITDVYQEAIAAKAAGLDVLISVRPGNGALPENHGFKTITSFHEI